ncbi:peptide ligase PGM1-related protein [Parafrankia sp. EUN1f]|uniref:peptide ligase PGM1-related protein n=1 Tax=Parafrankia sp. EUN1f TaxID=102897 RepID=UPI0001C45325|nr:peptide ligase PGM1-related protein [Parafrankia sp. EUN1f]EFC78953.1 protein of unknown function DUF201 [Parafrankia sp. EUN1f]
MTWHGRDQLIEFETVVRDNKNLRWRISCPSQEFADAEMRHGVGRWHSCVRGLWESLSLAREDDLALIMIQAPPVPDPVLAYLFSLAPSGTHALAPERRHAMISIADTRDVHLSQKIMDQPDLLSQLRSLVERLRAAGNPPEGLSCYASSPQMTRLCEELNLPLLETASRLTALGGKAQARQIFRDLGVPHPVGTYSADRDSRDLAGSFRRLREKHASQHWLIKIDSGFGSGHGIARLGTDSSATVPVPDLNPAAVRPFTPSVSGSEFLRHVADRGAVIEMFVGPPEGDAPANPSVLGYIGADGAQVLGTHDQIIGDTLSFAGCRFPAAEEYRPAILEYAVAVFDELARRGARGHVGVDFLAFRDSDGEHEWRVFALEINLRQTGTTHPNRTARALVSGEWTEAGELLADDGSQRYYWASDDLGSPTFSGISPTTLIEELQARPELHYDATRGVGVVPHLWTTLAPFGKIGATVIAESHERCGELLGELVALLERLSLEILGRQSG